MAADIDVRSMAIFASVPESTINNILTEPTAEIVRTFLQSLEEKVKQSEQTKAQKTRLEVELETIVRTNESKTKVLQKSRDKALVDVTKLREDLQAAERAKAEAQSEQERLQQSVESDASEVSTLRNRITSLESSHQDTLSLLDSKSKEIDRLAQDLTDEHGKVVTLRRELSKSEQDKEEAKSATQSAKFKQASLEQELELQKKNLDWYENERKIKNEEHQKFRREKNAKVTELQRTLEQQIELSDSLRRSENHLRSQFEDHVTRSEDLSKQIDRLQEDKIVDAEHNRHQIDDLTRLVELHKASADTAKARVEELSGDLDEAREDASDEIGRIRAEVQEEHNERQAAEQRVNELEARISELEVELQQPRSLPGTPRGEANGPLPSTPTRPGTPLGSFTPRSTQRLKNGMSLTQVYSAYTQLEKDLLNERRANEKLQAYVDQMLEDLEASKPQIEELRNDQARLQEEVVEISQSADDAKQQRDAAKKEASILQGHLDRSKTEVAESQQMCRDLGSQVRRLLLEQQAGATSDAEYARLVSELDEVSQRDMDHLSGAQQNVNQYLLGFRNIAELQSLNQKQLSTIRNLVSQLESEEAKEVQRRCEQLEQDLAAANTKISDYQAEIERMVTQTKSFVKERDMFRSMLTRRGQIDPTDFARSLPAGGLSNSIMGDRASPAPDNDIGKGLRDLQAQYDTFRRETQTDAASLRNQVAELTQRNSQLHTESSRNVGHLSAANQKFEILQANHETLKRDHQELQRRSNAAMETATRHELKTQQAAEDLIEARGTIDGLHREAANLKAEKDLWKSVEARLVDDNETLRNGRSRLDQLNTDLQHLLNEKELSDKESRRRYDGQVANLESELQTAKRKLNEELEERKQTALRRNYEHEQSQKRIEELLANLSNIREELAGTKSSRDYLQARVDELTVEIRSAEERLEVFSHPPSTSAPAANGVDDASLSRDQELAIEVSELKRDLELRSNELKQAEEQIDQYKAIAEDAEQRLQEFVDTNNEDKADLEASVTEKEQKIKDLEQRIEDISTELGTTNTELSKLRDDQSDIDRRLAEQKSALEAEIESLRGSEEKAQEQASLYREACKEQQNIAEQRQQNYETELVKHTEAVQNLQTVRTERDQVRLDVSQARNEAENAKADLQQKEASWSEIEARLKQETFDLKNRHKELEQHNKSLHASLDTITSQLAALQSNRLTSSVGNDTEPSQGQSHDLSSLHESLSYLRQEKEIAEVSLHHVQGELNQARREIQSLRSQLDDAKLKYSEQQRDALELERHALNQNKLRETVEQLNVYRESATTLRSEKKLAEQALSAKSEKLEELEQKIIPLKARIEELEDLKAGHEDEMKLLQESRDGWEQRTQNILSKYDRIDPAVLEELKSKVSTLEQEKAEAVAVHSALQVQIDGFPDAIEAAKAEQKQRLTDQFKNRDRDMREKRSQLQAELNTAKEQLEAARTENVELKAASAAPTEENNDVAPAQPENTAVSEESQARIQQLEQTVAEKETQIAALTTKQEEFKAREEEMKKRLNERLNSFKKEAETAKQQALEQTREALLAEHQKEMDGLKTQHDQELSEARSRAGLEAEQAQAAPQPMEITAGDEEAEVTGDTKTDMITFDELLHKITAGQAKLLIQKNETISNIVRANIRKSVEKEREELIQKTSEEITNELERRFIEEREEIIRQKDEDLKLERERMTQETQPDFESEKQALLDDHQQKMAEEVAKAKALAEKMAQGKLGLIQKQAASNLAKVNVVKKAAEETPEKPVKEVWEVAKVAKPPEVPKPTVAPSPAAASTSPAVPVAESQAQQPEAELAPTTNGAPSPAPEPASQEAEPVKEDASTAPATTVAAPSQNQSQPAQSGIPKPASQLPRGNYSGRGQRGNAQGGRGTGIPRAGSALGNHNVQPNLRGRGGNRGGHNPASPSRGGATNLNPSAAQFTPGKRPREEGQDDGNMGKRIRGGGAGS